MWTYVIAGIIALASIATILGEVKSYLSGVKQSGYVACQADQATANAKALAEKQRVAAAAASGLQSDRAERKATSKARSKPVEIIVEKPIYRNVCLDPAGLQCVNAALSGDKSATGCRADAAVPPTGTTH